MSMKRTTVDGKTVNERTLAMLRMWQFNSLTDYWVSQGSYNAGGVSASAGTHDGGGAVDLSVYGLGDLSDKKWHVKQGRLAGFAAWYRPTYPGLWNEHIHAIAIGDDELSSGARAQVSAYYNGRDGLAGNRVDPDPRLREIKVWPNVRLKKVSLLVVYRQFKSKKPVPRTAVKRVQWVLNEKLGTKLIVDGVAGPATRNAYKQWEKKIGADKPEGLPGRPSLKELGKGRFDVSWLGYEKWRKSQYDKAKASENEKNSLKHKD